MGENRCTKGRCQSLNMVVFFEALQVLWLLAEGALNADCNGKLYDDEIDICCDGHVVYGGAVGQWGCCGAGPYLLSRELCCNGTIYNVYHVEATNIRCCGSLSLDTTDGVCCNNEVLRGQTHCPYSVAGKIWLLSMALTSTTCIALFFFYIFRKRDVFRKGHSSINYKSIYMDWNIFHLCGSIEPNSY